MQLIVYIECNKSPNANKMDKRRRKAAAVRLTDSDYDFIQRAAMKEGRSIAGFLRFHALEAAQKTMFDKSDMVSRKNETAVF